MQENGGKYRLVAKKTVVRDVMDQLKALIASGELKPSDKIPTEAELAAMFGIGRSSVREAIKVFQYLGVVESSPKKGTFVCDSTNIATEALTWSFLLGKNEIYELVDLRDVIEQRSIQALTERAREDPPAAAAVFRELESELAAMRASLDSGSLEAQIQSDYDFHGTIIRSTGNNVFISIYHTLQSFMREEIQKTNTDDAARRSSIQEHEALLVAIRNGEPEKALAIFREHVRNIKQQLRHSLESGRPAG